MEELQNYLFENQGDFNDGHYVNLMALILKAHKEKNIIKNDRINRLHELYQPYDLFIITDGTWENVKDRIFSPDIIFSNILKEIVFIEVPEEYSLKIVFPTSLNTTDRQNIHVCSKLEGMVSISCGQGFDRFVSVFFVLE